MTTVFEALCSHFGLPPPVAEYRFAAPRRWRFDYAWPAQMVAVEIDGGQWLAHGGRHARDADRIKHNTAIARGWRVLHFSLQQIEADPVACFDLLRDALS